MAWTKFIVQTKVAAGSGTGVKATLRKSKTKPASLGLTLTDQVAAELGWADGDKLEVLIGDGAQHGLVRLRKNNSVGTAVVEGKKAIHDSHYFRITLGNVSSFVNRSEGAKWVQFEKVDEGGWVEVVMPSWADETAPKKGELPRVSPSIAVAANFERPRRDNTASIMGDPPAGRSALAERGGK